LIPEEDGSSGIFFFIPAGIAQKALKTVEIG
jgi:hypothetical protein